MQNHINKILITGGTGFVGSALLETLNQLSNYQVISVVRSNFRPTSDDVVVVDNIDGSTDYSSALKNIDVVVHAAARAHIMHDEVANPLAEYRKVNVEGTINLAKQAR